MLENGTQTWAVVTFFIYVMGVFALAWAAHRFAARRPFLSEYYLGSRGLGVWALALTIAATGSSGGSFTGFPSLIYTYGWIMALWIAGYMVVPILAMGLFGKRFNRVAKMSDALTLPDVFASRFLSPRLGLLTTLLLVFFLVVYQVAQFKAGGIMIQTLLSDLPSFRSLSIPLEPLAENIAGVSSGYLLGLGIFALTVVFYTTYGGFRAVVWTDVMQGIVMVVGVVLLLLFTTHKAYVYLRPIEKTVSPRQTETEVLDPYAGRELREQEPFRLSQLREGLEKSQAHLRERSPEALMGPGHKRGEDSSQAFLPLGLAISFFLIWPLSGAGHPGMMVRLMAFTDTAILRRALFAVCVFYGLIYLPLTIVFVVAKTLPISIEQPDQAMPAMALRVAPPALSGILIAAPFAAIMSTVDSLLLIISSCLVRDLYQRFLNPDASPQVMKWLSFSSTFVVGVIIVALAINPPLFLQDLVVFAASGQAATFLVAMALMLYWPRTTSLGAAAAMACGFGSVAGMYLVGKIQTGALEAWMPLGLHPFLWGLLFSLVGGIAGSLLTPPPSEKLVRKYFCRPSL